MFKLNQVKRRQLNKFGRSILWIICSGGITEFTRDHPDHHFDYQFADARKLPKVDEEVVYCLCKVMGSLGNKKQYAFFGVE